MSNWLNISFGRLLCFWRNSHLDITYVQKIFGSLDTLPLEKRQFAQYFGIIFKWTVVRVHFSNFVLVWWFHCLGTTNHQLLSGFIFVFFVMFYKNLYMYLLYSDFLHILFEDLNFDNHLPLIISSPIIKF